MAVLLVEEIKTTSRGGYPVHIIGLDPTSADCIVGDLQAHGMPQARVAWNLDGTARNHGSNANLDMMLPELADLAGLARKLGAA